MRKYQYCLQSKKDGTKIIGQLFIDVELEDAETRAKAAEQLFREHPEASKEEYELHSGWSPLI